MTRPVATAKKTFFTKLQMLHAFQVAESLLAWDRETHLPSAAAGERGETMAALAGLSHEMFTDKKFVRAAELLVEHQDQLTLEEARCVTLTHRELRKSVKLPRKFIEETNTITNDSYHAWVEAKAKNDFKIFQLHLKKVIENRQQYAQYLDPQADPYDTCLDDYEEGLTTAFLQPIFAELTRGLQELLPKVMQRQTPVKNPLAQAGFDQVKLRAFLHELCQTIGFDWQRGALGHVEHPFQISISPNDIRVNTHFSENDASFTIMGLVHELGHGLYEQNVDPKYRQVYLDHGTSLSIHESQSRFLENTIGRSPEFWQYFLPKLQAKFNQLKSTTLQDIVSALNLVHPTLIRTESDEVTYNLHIALRFEIENELMHGRLQVADLPEFWRTKMQQYLGIAVPSDREGVLQDVHWAWGNIGYFPTYSLGNLNAAQLYRQFEKSAPNWRTEISQGNFASYREWFKTHVWQHGSFYTAQQVMEKATGEKTNPKYLLEYLHQKYL